MLSKNYRSELVGVFGCPIDENPTGVMEEAGFAARGLDFRYLTIKVEEGDLGAAMQGLRAMHMRGINLTIPHKVAVLQYLDELSEAAAIIGAVNVVVNNDGKLWGENTDGKGFLTSLQDAGVSVQDKTVTVLGAGGAARAIAVECALAGAEKIFIVNRTAQRGQELADLLKEKTAAQVEFVPWQGTIVVPQGTHILVNATSIGLFPHVDEKPDIDYDTITQDMVVTDVIFNDPNSLFLQEAAARGAQTINGLGMLVNQGALNFTLWTGEEAPLAIMTETLKREFGL
ncbi:MAG: shikimate dehydrogenase [Chloroflexota bacterium]|nr:shikimate dehydrogenase [Chloroflexota bacterium]